MQDLSFITGWIDNFLSVTCGLAPWLTVTIECVLIGLCLLTLYAVLALFYIYFERKVCAFIQCRIGPNRVGPFGLCQVFADMFKMLLKEIIKLNHVDKFLFALAPFLVIMASMLAFSVLPWGNGLQVVDFNIGIFFLLATSSIGVLGILLAGWSSNNKFTLIGALRSGAQMVSYEISISLCVITMICLAGTMSVSEMCADQAQNGWYLFRGHIPAVIAFLIYVVAGTAETNRGPFDLPEAESELTAGYHTEYSGIHFGYFYLAEYLNLFIIGGVAALLFLGGWAPLHIYGWDAFNNIMDYIPSPLWFLAKAVAVTLLMIQFKWTFPRLRIDQLLNFEWKYLMPLSIANLVLMVVVILTGFHF